MHTLVTLRHSENSPQLQAGQDALKAHATEKSEKLTKYYDQIQEIEVVIEGGRDGHGGTHVEILVNATHNDTFVSNCNDENPYAAVDACIGKLERQLSEHKKKYRNRKHTVA